MSDTIIVSLIAAIPSSIAAAGAILAWLSSSETRRETKEVHLLINNRMDELLALTRKEQHAAGMEQEREEQAERDEQEARRVATRRPENGAK